MNIKRPVEIVVISDVHLGTYGCHAKELLSYLKSIQPKTLILNGDIIDIWNFRKSYFPTSHMDVIRRIIKMASKGTKVIYITGNHDDLLRKYTDIEFGNIFLVDKYIMEFDQKKAWIFHGDVFDASTKGYAKFIARIGGKGYDWLILCNRFINWLLEKLGQEKMSFSKKIKARVKKAVSWIANFETTAAELAIEKKYDYVICGHIHQPQMRIIKNNTGEVCYLNSGDWIENLTALEYQDQEWSIYQYQKNEHQPSEPISSPNDVEFDLLTKIISN